jgi:hypothetical protein
MPGQSHIDRTQIQMTISSALSGLVAFIVTPPRLKPGLGFQDPSGRNRLQNPTGSQGAGLAEPWVSVVKERVALKERKNRADAEQKKTRSIRGMTTSPIFFRFFRAVRV